MTHLILMAILSLNAVTNPTSQLKELRQRQVGRLARDTLWRVLAPDGNLCHLALKTMIVTVNWICGYHLYNWIYIYNYILSLCLFLLPKNLFSGDCFLIYMQNLWFPLNLLKGALRGVLWRARLSFSKEAETGIYQRPIQTARGCEQRREKESGFHFGPGPKDSHRSHG